MDSPETYISLYSGGGGLDLGFRRMRPDAECISYVEHEASAAALLVDHVEAELLDAAPVYTDAFTFPAGKFHGLVDWIIGGPPCQPFSVAGKQLGADDPRNLWPLTLRMVADIQPTGCFFENVPSADSLWYVYEEVIPGLRYLGYEVEAGIFSAAEVGAPHNRERIFILGLATGNDGCGQRIPIEHTGWEPEQGRSDVADTRQLSGQVPQAGEPDGTQRNATTGTSRELGDASSEGWQGPHNDGEPPRRLHKITGERRAELDDSDNARCGESNEENTRRPPEQPDVTDGTVADADSAGPQRRLLRRSDNPEGRQEPTRQPADDNRTLENTISERRRSGDGQREHATDAFPPSPTGDWGNVPERLWPAVKPDFRDVADELAGRVAALSRSQELRILGNGVVPATAAKAFTVLSNELKSRR